MKKHTTQIILRTITLSFFVSVLLSSIGIFKAQREIEEEIGARIVNLVSIYGQNLQDELDSSVNITRALKRRIENTIDLEKVSKNPEEMELYKQSLQTYMESMMLAANQNINWVFFDSETIDGHHSILLRRKGEKFSKSKEFNLSTLKAEQALWYTEPLRLGSYWSEPFDVLYSGDDLGSMITTYGEKIEVDGKIIGVAGIDFTLNDFSEKLSKVKLYKSGYLILMNQSSNMIYHPNKDFENFRTMKDGSLAYVDDAIRKSRTNTGLIHYETNGNMDIMVYYKLSNDWVIIGDLSISEMYASVRRMRNVLAVVTALCLIISLGERILYAEYKNYKKESEYMLITIQSLIKALEARDSYTKGHSNRVSELSVELGTKLNLSKKELNELEIAANLHDIGKIGIKDEVLLKKGKLSENEYYLIKQHTLIGAEILKPIKSLSNIVSIVTYHHEKWDGTGYPEGLKGEEIPLFSRIIALADSYDAITTNRPYRNKKSHLEAIEIIRENIGTQFCPLIADKFINMILDMHYGNK